MKSFFVVLLIAFTYKVHVVLVTKIIADNTDLDYDYFEDEDAKYFDYRGTLRQNFGLEAVLKKEHSSSICSPISALLPIGKLALGAEGKTLTELHKAIGIVSNLSYDYETPSNELATHFKSILKILQRLPGVILDIANRLYVSDNHRLRSKFSKLAKDIFNSSAVSANFGDTTRLVNSINGWVASLTHGMIPTILSSNDIPPNSSLVVVNAIYFAGKWKYPFPLVKVGTFYSSKGSREIPMMSRTADYQYIYSKPLSAEIVRIPYHGDKASFLVVLPKPRNELGLVVQRLKDEPNLLAWALSKMEMTRIKLTMPKFKIESQWNLRDLYKKVGISTIFKSQKSQLINIVKNQTLVVSTAIQKAVIDVNELGTEASASTAVIIGMASAPVDFEVCADHPFLFYVMAKTQQLFVGALF